MAEAKDIFSEVCHSDYRTNDDSISENLYSPVSKGSHPFPGKEEGWIRGGGAVVGKDFEKRKGRETVIELGKISK